MENDMSKKRAVTHLLSLALICTVLFASNPAHASSAGMRCGSHLITDGMHESEVKALCGEPSSERIIGYIGRGHHGYHREVLVTEFVYNFGPRKLMRALRFEGGRLVLIETIGYGHG